PRRSATFTAGLSIGALALAATPWDAWWLIAVACAVGGGAMSITMPSTNAVLGAVVGPSQRVLAVCVKQAAVPLALTAAAVALPLANAIGGWRVVFAGASVIGVAVLALFRWCTQDMPRPVSATPISALSSRRAQRAILRVGV